MRRLRKLPVYFMLILLIAATLTPVALANSAEPPGLTVVVAFPPKDLTLSLRFADGSLTEAVQLQKEQKAWEAYYRFFYGMVYPTRPSMESATLIVNSSEKSFEIPLPPSTFNLYNNLLTLDLAAESLAEGQTTARSVLLVSMRVVLTLLIEGLILFAFGYRKKSSWIIFFAVNLVTQGALNILLNGINMGYYWIFAFAFFEIIIFIVEMIAFALMLKEQTKGRAVVYALTANFASLVLGAVLLSLLPM